MMRFRWKGQTPKQLASKYSRRGKEFGKLQQAAAKEAGSEVERQILSRTSLSSRLNKQDAPGGADRNLSRNRPTRLRTESDETSATAKISIQAFWSKVREPGTRGTGNVTQAILSAFSAIGQQIALFRKGLWIKVKGGGVRFLAFAGHGGLQRWAFRPDKGQQFFRHTVRVASAPILSRTYFVPSLEASRAKILALWRSATKRGFQS